MTVAVALRAPEGVWIASDMLARTGCLKLPVAEPKWVYNETMPVAACIAGSSYHTNRLHKVLKMGWPDTIADMAETIGEVVKTSGFVPEHDKGDYPDWHFDALITDGQRLVHMFGSLTWMEVDRSFHAIGSGMPYALGAMYALNGSDEPFENRVIAAVAAANNFDDGCQDLWGPVLVPNPEYRAAEHNDGVAPIAHSVLHNPAMSKSAMATSGIHLTQRRIVSGPDDPRYRTRA